MGMLFGGWAKEDEELSNKELEEREWYYKNHVYPSAPKKAIFRGIELQVGDMITPGLNEERYIIRDFLEKGAIPIVDLVSNEKHDEYNIPWQFPELFVIKSIFDGI